MAETPRFDLSDLKVEDLFVTSVDSLESLSEGHGMTELAASSHYSCSSSLNNFVADDDLV